MANNKEFKPYIPAEKITPEITVVSVVMGILLAVIFGAANAYLGLRVGMTISASIPAAVISMAVIRVILKKSSILESNISQTIGSAGESLAAGAIFTLPALFLWASEGLCESPRLLDITVIAICGGILGVLFMVPLRNALIVKEHATLPYPEGTACADVLLAGEKSGSGAVSVFAGMGVAAAMKLIVDGFKVMPASIAATFETIKGHFSLSVYPALVGVGYIVGPRVASTLFAGSLVSWMVLIPLICFFGWNSVIEPNAVAVSEVWETSGPSGIWSSYVRYIGAGAIVTGGIISLIKTLPVIVTTFGDSIKGLKDKSAKKSTLRTDRDLPITIVLSGSLTIVFVLWLLPFIPVDLIGAILIVICGFFFATVSSRIVGLIGASNNPISGMAIATLLITTIVMKATGNDGIEGMQAAIVICSIVCIVAAMAGDTSQDLKTGYLLGATPKKQQIGVMIGSLATALAIGGILYLLNLAWGFGSTEVPAPQAMLMKTIVEGVMGGNLPWNLVFIGVFLALALEVVKVPVMPFAIGVYLPIETITPIMVGGLIRWALDKRKKVDEETKERQTTKGTLFSAGLIAGEGLAGVVLALLAVFGVDGVLNLSGFVDFGMAGSVVILVLLILSILKFSIWTKDKASDFSSPDEKPDV